MILETKQVIAAILAFIASCMISYGYGKHRGEVEKHREIFTKFREAGLMPPEAESE